MAYQLVRSIIFCSILLVGIFFIIFFDNVFFVYKGSYQKNLKGIDNKQVQTLFLGDSHAEVLEFDNPLIYNLASGGDTTREMYLKLLYALQESKGLKYLFLQADPHILCKYRFTEENKLFIKDLVPRFEYNRVYGINEKQSIFQDLIDQFPFLSGDLYVLARKKFLMKITYWFSKGNVSHQQSHDYSSKSLEERKNDASHRAKVHFSSGKDEEFVFYYQEIIKLCKQRGVNVIGIRYPVSQEYLQASEVMGRSGLITQIDAMGFDKVLDYSNLFPRSSMFENSDHFNLESSRILLNQIYKDFFMIDS